MFIAKDIHTHPPLRRSGIFNFYLHGSPPIKIIGETPRDGEK